MNGPSKYNSFTAADIERYHKGMMSAAERNALEKAALDDPFLADALEGYAYTPSAVADLENIKARLQGKNERSKIVPLFSKKFNWLQIAALFIVLVGAGWFLYRSGSFGQKEIAISTPAKQQPVETFSTPLSPDSSSMSATPQPAVVPEEKQTPKAAVVANKKSPVKEQRQKAEEENSNMATDLAVAAAAEQAKELAERRSLARRQMTKDVAPITSTDEPTNKAATLSKKIDGAGDSVPGYITLQKKVEGVQVSDDTIKNLNMVMQPAKEGMSEVEVVGFGAKSKAAARPLPKFEELEPAEGWTNFNDYIAENLQQPEELKEKAVSGEVELSFDIDKKGQAVNIKVEKSLCSKCDEEAVRLVKEGPKWKKKKDKKGKVSIHF